jgi:hypothetical protein
MTEPPDNVVVLPMSTTLPLPAGRVLSAAIGQVETVVVIGREPDGTLYFASSMSDAAAINWLLELARQRLLRAVGE